MVAVSNSIMQGITPDIKFAPRARRHYDATGARNDAHHLLLSWWEWAYNTNNQAIKFRGPYSQEAKCKDDAAFLNRNRAPGQAGYWCAGG